MLLEPSSPFARPEHFDEAIELYVARKADLVVGMRETEVSSIFVGPIGKDGSIGTIVDKMLTMTTAAAGPAAGSDDERRALFDRLERDAQAPENICRSGRSYGILMDRLHSIEIETTADLAYASYVIEHGMLDASPWQPKSP